MRPGAVFDGMFALAAFVKTDGTKHGGEGPRVDHNPEANGVQWPAALAPAEARKDQWTLGSARVAVRSLHGEDGNGHEDGGYYGVREPMELSLLLWEIPEQGCCTPLAEKNQVYDEMDE